MQNELEKYYDENASLIDELWQEKCFLSGEKKLFSNDKAFWEFVEEIKEIGEKNEN